MGIFIRMVTLTGVILAICFLFLNDGQQVATTDDPLPKTARHEPPQPASSTQQTWGRMETLADHFARHGRDFQARDSHDYAAQAAAFLQRAKSAGFQAKRDSDGSLRIFDRASGAFGAYNSDGTTRTYFKPGSRDYFERQPGLRVDLRTAR